MRLTVKLNTTKDYATALKARLRRERISQNQLAAELQRDASQVCRWFTTNPARRVTPGIQTVMEIEEAMCRIVKRRTRNAKRAAARTKSGGAALLSE